MNNQFEEARLAVQKAREALRNDNRTQARQWAEQAASLAPQMEDPWLILAAVASPRASVEYIQKALKINPDSPRARRGMEWAIQRLRESPEPQRGTITRAPLQSQERSGNKPPSRRSPWFPILLLGLGCVVCAVAAWSASTSPVLASIMNSAMPTPTHPQQWAQAEIPKPTYTPAALSQETATPQAAFEPTFMPTEMSIELPTEVPTDTPIPLPTDTELPSPEPTWSGSMSMDIVPDTPTSEVPTYSA
ncbi:MAG: tetratricopeptide repeat protein, partial [Anaerolineales bacterium]